MPKHSQVDEIKYAKKEMDKAKKGIAAGEMNLANSWMDRCIIATQEVKSSRVFTISSIRNFKTRVKPATKTQERSLDKWQTGDVGS